MWTEEIAAALPSAEVAAEEPRPAAEVGPADWRPAVVSARDVLGLDFFDWLSAVDEGEGAFRVVVHLWSVADRRGLLLSTVTTAAGVASIADVYPGADWHERETHEMFGLGFAGHPGLKPLLLAPEFEGHPLRKDFVLAARVAKPWPGAKEPGGDGPRKRQPMRPPGVPAPGEWGPAPEGEAETEAPPARPARKAARPSRPTAGPVEGATSPGRPAAEAAEPGPAAPEPTEETTGPRRNPPRPPQKDGE